jgi:hypothetical protein
MESERTGHHRAARARAGRRGIALLCLAACGGFLYGTIRERVTRGTTAPAAPPAPAHGVKATPAAAPPGSGDLTGTAAAGTNLFTAPAAAAMEAGDYEAALGRYRADLAVARTDAERLALADKLREVGLSAHMRDRGQGRVALAAYEEALTVYRAQAAGSRLAAALPDLADAALIRGEREMAKAAWDEALTLPETRKDAGLLARAGSFRQALGDYDGAESVLKTALALHRAEHDDRGAGHALRYLGALNVELRRYDTAKAQLAESARLLAKVGPTEAETRAAVLGTWGDALLGEGNAAGAERLYREGLAVWKARGQAFWTGVFEARMADAALSQGRLAEAKRLAESGLRRLEQSNGPARRALPLRVLGDAARAEGNFAKAEQYYRESLALCEEVGSPAAVARLRTALADLARDAKKPPR